MYPINKISWINRASRHQGSVLCLFLTAQTLFPTKLLQEGNVRFSWYHPVVLEQQHFHWPSYGVPLCSGAFFNGQLMSKMESWVWDWVPSWVGMEVKYFAESKRLKCQLSPTLVKFDVTSMGSGYHIHGIMFHRKQMAAPFLPPTSHGRPVSDCSFWPFLPTLSPAPPITTAAWSPLVNSAKPETSEVMYEGAFS